MEILRSENIYQGWFRIDRLFLKNKGKEFTRDRIVSKDAVAAVVYDEKLDKYIFVEQFRPGPQKNVIELAAGLIEDLSPMDTMIKEIEEELGYLVDTIGKIRPAFYTTPGKTNEKMYLFYATVSKQISKGGGLETENEDIEVIKVPKEDIDFLEIEDGKTLVGLASMGLL